MRYAAQPGGKKIASMTDITGGRSLISVHLVTSGQVPDMRCPKCGFRNPSGFEYCGKCGKRILTGEEHEHVVALCHEVNGSLAQHLGDLRLRPSSERSKTAIDFKNKTGMPAEQAAKRMQRLEKHLKEKKYDVAASVKAPVKGLADYYASQREKIRSNEKDPDKRKEELKFIGHCASTAIELAGLVATILG